MLFSFSNFLYPYGHQICFGERILAWSLSLLLTLFQSMCKCRRQAKCIRVSALCLYVYEKRGREKRSAQSIFIYFVHIDFLVVVVDFDSLFAASINTHWSVYSRNKIHLTSNKCRSIPGLNDFFLWKFGFALNRTWFACRYFLHSHSIPLCECAVFTEPSIWRRKPSFFSLFNLSIESLDSMNGVFSSPLVAGQPYLLC